MYLGITCYGPPLELIYSFSNFHGFECFYSYVNMFEGQMHACFALRIIRVTYGTLFNLDIPQNYSF